MKICKNSHYLIELVDSIISPIVVDVFDGESSHTETLANTDMVKDYFKKMYASFLFSIPDLNELSLDECKEIFSRTWDLYLDFNQDNLNRIYKAYKTEYEPLDNYDGYSKVTTTYEGIETNVNTKSGEYDIIHGAKHTTTTNSASPDDDSNFFGTTKSEDVENSFNDKTRYTDLTDENEKSFTNRVDTVEERKHGNLGVTQSQQMLRSEIGVRNLRYLDYVVGEFVAKYMTISPQEIE